MIENTRKRVGIPAVYLETANKDVFDVLTYRLLQKGNGSLASSHEILGILTEEFHELVDAVKSNDPINVRRELIDIAVGCLLGIGCIDAGTLDW